MTILRDGEGQGAYEVDGRLSENGLIALMVGRPIDTEYPVGSSLELSDIVLSSTGLTGSRFHDVGLFVRRGVGCRICRLGG